MLILVPMATYRSVLRRLNDASVGPSAAATVGDGTSEQALAATADNANNKRWGLMLSPEVGREGLA